MQVKDLDKNNKIIKEFQGKNYTPVNSEIVLFAPKPPDEKKTKGGIIMPPTAAEREAKNVSASFFTVVAVDPELTSVAVGDRILMEGGSMELPYEAIAQEGMFVQIPFFNVKGIIKKQKY